MEERTLKLKRADNRERCVYTAALSGVTRRGNYTGDRETQVAEDSDYARE